MATHSKELCPCGSGKRYKHCHQPIDARRRRNLFVAGGVVVLIVAAAVFAGPRLLAKARGGAAKTTAAASAGVESTGVVLPNGAAGPPLRDPNALTLRPPNSGELAPGEHPKPWEYDIAHDRYYDPRPGHMHWHSGAPPADPNAPPAAPQIIVRTPNGTPVQVVTTTTPAPAAPATPTGK